MSSCTRPGWTRAGSGAGDRRRHHPGPGQWDGWYAKWAGQYAQWVPANLGQLTWPFRCLMDRDDITGRLGDIGCPALIVHGGEDAAIPLARAEEMRNGLPGPATFTVIGGAPHASKSTHPGERTPRSWTSWTGCPASRHERSERN